MHKDHIPEWAAAKLQELQNSGAPDETLEQSMEGT
jgi:hypothetical protein